MISSPRTELSLSLPSEQLLEFRASVLSSLEGFDDPRIELLCEIPAWSTECFDDLSSCQDLRKRTLAALHNLLDDLRSRGLSPKYRLLTSTIPFSSIRVADPAGFEPAGGPDVLELSGKIDARGPARRNSDALRAELDGLKMLDDRLIPHALVLAHSKSTTGPTLVMT